MIEKYIILEDWLDELEESEMLNRSEFDWNNFNRYEFEIPLLNNEEKIWIEQNIDIPIQFNIVKGNPLITNNDVILSSFSFKNNIQNIVSILENFFTKYGARFCYYNIFEKSGFGLSLSFDGIKFGELTNSINKNSIKPEDLK